VSASGTSAGKTFVTRGIVRAYALRGKRVTGLKPIETGCDPHPLDAQALARAARPVDSTFPQTAADPSEFYRVAPPLSPYAVQLTTGEAVPDLDAIASYVRSLEPDYDQVVVEGAGGLLVPVDAQRSIADLVAQLGYPLLLVAPDQLGVLSHVLTACEAARRRGLPLAAVVLTQQQPMAADPSVASNARILSERLDRPVLRFPYCTDHDDVLAAAADSCGLINVLG
jgi:dethiobiotin synthase